MSEMNTSRPATAAAVALAHLIVILLLMQARTPQRTVSEHSAPTLTFLEDKRELRSRLNDRQQAHPIRFPPLPITLPPPALADLSADHSAPAAVDWRREGEESARNSLWPEEAKAKPRTFSRKPGPEHEPPAEPNLFSTEGSNPPPGTTERLDDGTLRQWISRNCYYESSRLDPMNDGSTSNIRLQTPICKPAASKADGKIFEHLKPGYLLEND